MSLKDEIIKNNKIKLLAYANKIAYQNDLLSTAGKKIMELEKEIEDLKLTLVQMGKPKDGE